MMADKKKSGNTFLRQSKTTLMDVMERYVPYKKKLTLKAINESIRLNLEDQSKDVLSKE